jgi:hypothetical protein
MRVFVCAQAAVEQKSMIANMNELSQMLFMVSPLVMLTKSKNIPKVPIRFANSSVGNSQ